MGKIQSHKDLMVYQMAMDAAMRVFQLTKEFPREERYSLVDQVRKSSRSICANIAEAWRRRRYKAAFICKLNDAESEAEEMRVWLEFCLKCGYLDESTVQDLDVTYDHTIGKLVCMINDPDSWVVG